MTQFYLYMSLKLYHPSPYEISHVLFAKKLSGDPELKSDNSKRLVLALTILKTKSRNLNI
jgi:hypothetical protein